MSRLRFSKIPFAVLSLACCAGALQAATLVANPTALTLNCDTVLGPTPATVGITLAVAGSAVNVTVTAPAGPVVLPSPAVLSVGSTSVATSFAFSVAAGCKGATNGQVVVLTFTPSTGTLLTVNATLNITNSGSALAPSPSSVFITCTKTGSSYTPGPSQTVNVTSPSNGGTPFTVDNSSNALPSWLSVTPLTGGTATATPIALTVVAKSGCGALPVGSTSFSVHLLNAPAPDKLLAVTIEIGSASSLSASVSPVALSYTKGSGTHTPVTSAISASPAVYFSVDPATLPLWLNASPTSGTTTSPVTLSLVPTAGAETLSLGSYSANVHLKVSGALDFVLPVSLQVKNPAATLTVSEGTTRTINWTLGTTLPSLLITAVSSDSPISFAVTTTAGTLSPQVSATSGLAYSFGTPISVTFLQSIFGAAAPGAALSGHVILTPTTGSPVDVLITINVKAPGAAISSILPASLPTATSGTFTVALSGSGFVVNSDPSIGTRVGIVTGGLIVSDSNVVASVVNSTSIILSITAPASADPYLPFSGLGGSVSFGVCNPQGATCSTPTGTVALTIGVNPIVQAVTSGSSYTEVTAPALTPVAPYDILSIFGTNFCISVGTGCTGSNAILYGSTDPVTLRYLNSLSPDSPGSTQRNLTVTFQTHASSPVAIATAPLQFATNNQINLLVPDAVKTYIGSTVDIVVSFGYGSGSTMLKGSPYSVTIAATDPGVFSIGGDGQGDAAALSASYALISSTNPAGARSTSTDSDIIQLYVTGLGRPDSDGTGGGYSATCMPTDSYWAAVNSSTSVSPALTSNDGLVLQSALFPSGQIQPCVKSTSPNVPSVTVGGVTGAVKFAGWVAGSVAGLYQINVQLPSSSSTFTDAAGATGPATSTAFYLPIVVTAAGKSSQRNGVDLWVVRSLQVVSTGAVSGASGSAWAGSAVVASEGSGTYTYSSGTMPAGLTLNADGTITGNPTTPGTSTVVFTATDSVNGCTGTVSITFTIT
jgi:uncharacterized protein (TIGR03437 family)